MRRYLGLLGHQLRTAVVQAMQYRWEFILEGVTSIIWIVTGLAPLLVVYGQQRTNAMPGWTFEQTLALSGWFVTLKGFLDGAIAPGIQAVIGLIRTGGLDFLLLKPVDAQFLVSTARFQVWRVTSMVSGLVILGYSFQAMGRWPSLLEVGESVLLMLAGTMVLYSLCVLVLSVSFRAVRLDSLQVVFLSVFEAARWPRTAFRGVVSVLFTFVIPLALMTSYPTEALLGRLEPGTLFFSVVLSLAFSVVARLVWRFSLRHYTSASS